MSLPKFQTSDRILSMLQSQWAAQIDPVLSNPLSSGILLPNLSLASGANVVNHKLGRNLQGWIVTRNNAAVTIYDTQATNNTPNLTLNLVTSGACTVSLYVF